MIIGVFGLNGHGKGQLLIDLFLKYHEENDKREKQGQQRRKIYTNVHGINSKGKKPLKDCYPIPEGNIWFGKQDDPDDVPPEGYFIPEIGSIFCYDESQDIETFKQKSGALSTHPSVISLAKQRHSGLDVIFATQQMNYLHSHIQGLFSPIYVVERPLNAPMTNVFKFNKAKQSGSTYRIPPNDQADDHSILRLGKKYGAYYISSAEHNMKAQVPLKLKILIGVFICVCAYTGYNFYNSKFGQQAIENYKAENEEQPKQITQPQIPQPQIQPQIQQMPQVQHKDEQQQKREHYLPELVHETAYDEDIRVAGFIRFNGKCTAINSYGERLRISEQQCNFLAENPGFVPRLRASKSTIDDVQPVQNSNTRVNKVSSINQSLSFN